MQKNALSRRIPKNKQHTIFQKDTTIKKYISTNMEKKVNHDKSCWKTCLKKHHTKNGCYKKHLILR